MQNKLVKKIAEKVQQKISASGSDLSSSDSGSNNGSGYGGFANYSPPHQGGGYGSPHAYAHHGGYSGGYAAGYPPASPSPGYPPAAYGSPYSGHTPLTGPPPPIVPNFGSEASGSPGTPIAQQQPAQQHHYPHNLQANNNNLPNRPPPSPSPAPNNNNAKPPAVSPSPRPAHTPQPQAQSPSGGGAYAAAPKPAVAKPAAPAAPAAAAKPAAPAAAAKPAAPALQQAKPPAAAPLPNKPAAAAAVVARPPIAANNAVGAYAGGGGGGAANKPQAIFVNDSSKVELLRQLRIARDEGWISDEQYELGVKALLYGNIVTPGAAGGAGGAAAVSPAPPLASGGGAYAASDLFALPHCREELVTKKWFDWRSQKWMSEQIKVQLDLVRPFSEGNLRLAYKALDLSRKPGQRAFVAKRQKEKCFDADGVFEDVKMQEECREWARKFNAENPPKRVEFVEAFLIERNAPGLRTAEKLYAMEPFMSGKYAKYNNNYGWVAPEDRNTPQAFSHFTWERSKHRFMIVDIQGVGDNYTDPQCHTTDGKGYGAGNMGPSGIGKFLSTHKCSNICKALGLPTYQAKIHDIGTQPMRVTGKPGQQKV